MGEKENKMKTCTKCNKEKHATEEFFVKQKSNKSGLGSQCKECRSNYLKIYKKKNKEKIKQLDKQYRENNKGKIAIYQRRYYKNNKAIIKYNTKRYYEKNKEYVLNRNKMWWKSNKDRIKVSRLKYRLLNADKIKDYKTQYYKDNREKVYETVENWRKNNLEKSRYIRKKSKHKRRLITSDLISDFTEEEWEKCKKHFDNKCCYCGYGDSLEQEHFIPVSKYGGYTVTNILPSCRSCNASKYNNSFEDWYPSFRHFSKERNLKIINYINKQKST
jgi:HNH endonuclease